MQTNKVSNEPIIDDYDTLGQTYVISSENIMLQAIRSLSLASDPDFVGRPDSQSLGSRVRGLRVNEDTQSLQLRDLSGNLHSYWKDELAEINYLFGKTPMPSVRALLNDAELNDLIAYLTTLKDIR